MVSSSARVFFDTFNLHQRCSYQQLREDSASWGTNLVLKSRANTQKFRILDYEEKSLVLSATNSNPSRFEFELTTKFLKFWRKSQNFTQILFGVPTLSLQHR